MTRQKQRKTVFQLIYALNYQGMEQKDVILEDFYKQHELEEIPYITETFNGICENWDVINKLIEPVLANWSMKRLDAVCLAVLRVAVNEAIELAKEFGTEDAGSFVHGVLSSIAK